MKKDLAVLVKAKLAPHSDRISALLTQAQSDQEFQAYLDFYAQQILETTLQELANEKKYEKQL